MQRRKAGVRASKSVAGAASAAAALFAFGMTPLAHAPAANADFGIDDLFDLIDPNLAVSAIDTTAAAALPAADPNTVLADLFQQDFWLPLHTDLEAWINSSAGEQFDNAINPFFAQGDFCGLICNGTDGTFGRPHWR